MTFYSSGMELERHDKLRLLTEWEPSFRWLHPCQKGSPGEINCGRCKKCIRDITTLYAFDKLERYGAVLDLEDFTKNLAARLGSALAVSNMSIYDKPAELLKKSGKPIPPAAYIYAKQFDRAMDNLRAQETERGGKRQ